jgi:hypothetical protein
MPSWQSFPRIPQNFFLLELKIEFFSSMQPMHLLNALLVELYKLLRDSVFFYAFLCTVLPPRYLTTLRFPP